MTESDRLTPDKRIFICQDGLVPCLSPLFLRQRDCVEACKTDIILSIRYLRSEPADRKQFVVTGIALDQATLDTAFKRCREQQAIYNGNITGKHPQP